MKPAALLIDEQSRCAGGSRARQGLLLCLLLECPVIDVHGSGKCGITVACVLQKTTRSRRECQYPAGRSWGL